MKDLVIIGAGDFARETAWITERINQEKTEWNLLGFVDDTRAEPLVDGYPVLGKISWLREYPSKVYAVCAIGTGVTREVIWRSLSLCRNICPATLIDPGCVIGRDCEIGAGSILCAGTILAISVKLGFSSIVNFNCTLGHDLELEPYCTVHPGSNLSGRVHIGKCTEIGTGTRIIQGATIASHIILGAGAVVCRNLFECGTYVGVPARKIK